MNTPSPPSWFTQTLGNALAPAALAADSWTVAEEEIAAARERHGERDRGPIWGAFLLLQHTEPLEHAPSLYRAHVRELLDRVAAGRDTRPATDAELLASLSAGSVQVPAGPGALCLAARLIARLPADALPPGLRADDVEYYERVHSQDADTVARGLQAILTQRWRALTMDA
ncbi:hypothetical protein [Kitasatospora griseola]|uniref:hypothetical protein n=1 Tax=Kitasatospora griseola TaxID=2064 RepID=UPI003432742B